MSDIWEPWRPEIGQRVRVVARGECDYCPDDEDGWTGVVIAVVHDPSASYEGPEWASHHYWVKYDESVMLPGMGETSHYAASELEPIND